MDISYQNFRRPGNTLYLCVLLTYQAARPRLYRIPKNRKDAGGGRFGWDTWFSGETEGVGGSVFANRVLRGDHRELTAIPMNCQCRGRS